MINGLNEQMEAFQNMHKNVLIVTLTLFFNTHFALCWNNKDSWIINEFTMRQKYLIKKYKCAHTHTYAINVCARVVVCVHMWLCSLCYVCVCAMYIYIYIKKNLHAAVWFSKVNCKMKSQNIFRFKKMMRRKKLHVGIKNP